MPTVNLGAPAQQGSWVAGSFQTPPGGGMYSEGSFVTGGARWTGVPVPRGAEVTSAVLSLTARSGSATIRLLLVDNQGSLAASGWTTAPTATGVAMSASVDLTAAVQSLVDRAGWSEGNALAIRMESAATAEATATGLTITWVDPMQFIGPVGAATLALAGQPVTPSYSVRVGTATLELAAQPVEVVAPHEVGPVTAATLALAGQPVGLSGTGAVPVTVGGATLALSAGAPVMLARTLPPAPPPQPWERVVATQEYADAIMAYEAEIDTVVDILDDAGTVLATLGGEDATHTGVLGGEVTCDGTSHIRWTGSLQLGQTDLVPLTPSDLLHPLAHHRARIWWRIRLANGTWARVPVGTMYIDDTEVSDDGAAEVTMTIPLSDAAAVVKRATMEMSVPVGGMWAHQAITLVLSAAAPAVPLAITDLPYRLPNPYDAGEPGADPWAVADQIARSAGARLYVDRMGTIVCAPVVTDPSPVVSGLVEGPGCRVVRGTRGTSLDRVANVVTVTSGAQRDEDGKELEPITATAADDDATSPTWVGKGYIYRPPPITVDEITTQEQAETYARRELDDRRAPVAKVVVEHYPHPHLEPDDVVPVDLPRIGVAGERRVTGWSLVLGASGLQRTDLASRREMGHGLA